ncbi:MAG: NADH-quinone oxidoreductase subunit I [Thaumarchaeota archaeon]|nr:NADH-quinone oxidoreductase subunit I [Nitrososphaerota archaeon]
MSAIIRALNAFASGVQHLFKRRFTFRYPEQKLEFEGEGYLYDPKTQVGISGFKGRHLLHMDKCTGCQLCSLACENIAMAIEMVPIEGQWPRNKKSIFPQIDYGRCVFCGFCVDACPFYALFETNDYELCGYDRRSLVFTPKQLSIPPPKEKGVTVIFDEKKGEAHHG